MRTAEFFDLSEVSFSEVFDGTAYVWDAIGKLDAFLTSLFAQGRVVANYEEKNVHIGKGTVIEEGALIKGPSVVGENCYIGHTAFLRENCLIGNNVRIGHGCEVKHSVLLPQCAVAHLNYVGDSIIGSRVNVAVGAKLANLRFDGKAIRIKDNGNTIETGLVKLGAIVGDGSQIGTNAVLNPGTILGKNCIVYPLVSVRGVHKEGSVIKK